MILYEQKNETCSQLARESQYVFEDACLITLSQVIGWIGFSFLIAVPLAFLAVLIYAAYEDAKKKAETKS